MTRLIRPDWPAPAGVAALVTTRHGGASKAPWDSYNLGDHVGDEPQAVAANRMILRQHLPSDPVWLRQIHGVDCVDAARVKSGTEADASFTRQRGPVCAIITADCLPVLLCDRGATVVGAAHAGWRGLAAGVIEATVQAMDMPAENLMAWLGPAIGPQAFEVGAEVRACFIDHDPRAVGAFSPNAGGRWLCDIYQLARLRLRALGLENIFGGGFCTVNDSKQFFSYRRDGVSGRMANCIWLE